MNKLNRTIYFGFLLAIISACSMEKDSNSSSKSAGKDNPIRITGKPSVPISMSYTISKNNLVAGDDFDVAISFQSKIDSSITVKTNSFKKLIGLNAKQTWKVKQTKSGEKELMPLLKFEALGNGTHYIRFTASVVEDGVTLTKPFIIAVEVGNAEVKLKSAGKVIIDDKGQTVIIQKAGSNN